MASTMPSFGDAHTTDVLNDRLLALEHLFRRHLLVQQDAQGVEDAKLYGSVSHQRSNQSSATEEDGDAAGSNRQRDPAEPVPHPALHRNSQTRAGLDSVPTRPFHHMCLFLDRHSYASLSSVSRAMRCRAVFTAGAGALQGLQGLQAQAHGRAHPAGQQGAASRAREGPKAGVDYAYVPLRCSFHLPLPALLPGVYRECARSTAGVAKLRAAVAAAPSVVRGDGQSAAAQHAAKEEGSAVAALLLAHAELYEGCSPLPVPVLGSAGGRGVPTTTTGSTTTGTDKGQARPRLGSTSLGLGMGSVSSSLSQHLGQMSSRVALPSMASLGGLGTMLGSSSGWVGGGGGGGGDCQPVHAAATGGSPSTVLTLPTLSSLPRFPPRHTLPSSTSARSPAVATPPLTQSTQACTPIPTPAPSTQEGCSAPSLPALSMPSLPGLPRLPTLPYTLPAMPSVSFHSMMPSIGGGASLGSMGTMWRGKAPSDSISTAMHTHQLLPQAAVGPQARHSDTRSGQAVGAWPDLEASFLDEQQPADGQGSSKGQGEAEADPLDMDTGMQAGQSSKETGPASFAPVHSSSASGSGKLTETHVQALQNTHDRPGHGDGQGSHTGRSLQAAATSRRSAALCISLDYNTAGAISLLIHSLETRLLHALDGLEDARAQLDIAHEVKRSLHAEDNRLRLNEARLKQQKEDAIGQASALTEVVGFLDRRVRQFEASYGDLSSHGSSAHGGHHPDGGHHDGSHRDTVGNEQGARTAQQLQQEIDEMKEAYKALQAEHEEDRARWLWQKRVLAQAIVEAQGETQGQQ